MFVWIKTWLKDMQVIGTVEENSNLIDARLFSSISVLR